MGLFRNLKELVTGNTIKAISNQEIGLEQLNFSGAYEESREAIYPQWFFSSKLGQPRGIDTIKIRGFSKSAWVQMVLNSFKKQIFSMEWDIIKEDVEDMTDRTDDINTVEKFLKNINKNKDDISDLNSELITDIGEIDSGCYNLIYSTDSYEIGQVPEYDAWGRQIGTYEDLMLKPLGQREIVGVKTTDSSSILKQVDIHKNLLNYWQYSFKHPRQNPTRFETDEIVYMLMNKKTYSVYGFSPVEAIQQILELLIQGTRYNKDIYTNNAIPDLLVSLPKVPLKELERLKNSWMTKYKGKTHPVGFINWAIDAFHKLADSNRDLEWLDGQQWYFKIVFAVFGVSPTEAGFFENSNKSNDEGQERVTIRNALKPYLKVFETAITSRIITEILQREDHGLKFKYKPRDHTLEKIEFDQDMTELDKATLTINEFRLKKGRKTVDWGDVPYERSPAQAINFTNLGGDNNPNKPDDDNNDANENIPDDNKDKNKHFSIGKGNSAEPKNYAEFLLKMFNDFEKRVLSAVDKIDIDKCYKSNTEKELLHKTFGEFLMTMFNVVNTVSFASKIKKYLKIDLVFGLQAAEKELNVDIGFTQPYQDKLNKIQGQQVDGYTINGKKWPGIKGVTKEVQADIIHTVQDGIQQNKTTVQIKDDIKLRFDKLSDWRSNMIARTENTNIRNEGKLMGYKESGLEGKKVWLAAIDDRTSPICRRLNGQERDLDDNFIDPETNMAYQRPAAHPHCRSTLYFKQD